jgi:Mn-dependent DtxR family transcriptional regulator
MDPVQAAKKLIDSLVDEELVLQEAYENDEEENDEEEGEEEEGGEEKSSAPAPKQSGATQTQASVASKPTAFGKGASGQLVHDAHGSGESDAHGGGVQLGTMQYTDTAAQNQASVAMKPSFASGGATKMSEEQVRQDIYAIFGSSELSEEFIDKAGSLYEAAVLAKANEVIQEIHEQYEAAFEQEVEDVKQELTEKVDSYLNYVVDEWMNENKLAIENGIRTEIAENFIGKLKDLFVESYIEVPQNKTNLFDEMAETIEELEGRVNEEVQRNVTLVNENRAMKAVGIFMEQTKHLTDVQSDKVAKLAENIEFNNEEDFADKIKTLVENVSTRTPVTETTVQNVNNKYLVEETVIEEDNNQEDTINDPYIRLYSDILSRTLQK